MDEVITQVEVERELLRLCGLTEKALGEVRRRGEALARARVAFKLARARAYLMAEGTVPEREAHADEQTGEQMLDYEMAEALSRSAQEAGRTYRAQLDVLRSINSNLRAQV